MQSNPLYNQYTNIYTTFVLTVIALFLGVIALRPVARPATVLAQSDSNYLYVEPRTTMLRKPDGRRQVEGKVVIDMRNGDIWGFPTFRRHPIQSTRLNSTPPVSNAMYLGRFDFSKMTPADREKSKH
jgi:hypothetical protein